MIRRVFGFRVRPVGVFGLVAFVAFAFGAIVVEAAYAEGPLWSIFGSQAMLVLTGTVVLLVVLCMVSVAMAQPSSNPFGLMPGSFQFIPSTVAAGAHEDLVTKFDFAHNAKGEPFNDLRRTVVELPAGFMGNNTAVPTCTDAQLLGNSGNFGNLPQCPLASQIGQISVRLNVSGAAQDTFPLYNMEVTSFGVTAELAFKTVDFTQVLLVSVRPGDSGITVTAPSPKVAEPRNITVTIWGLPASHEHDAQRGEVCLPLENNPEGECYNELGGPQPSGIPVKPFLANPTSCGSFVAKMEADSWEEIENWSRAESNVGPIGECERVPFDPSIEALPTTSSAESSSGLNVSLLVPQSWENPLTLATSNVEEAKVTLPKGYTVNPSEGSGLAGCTLQQYESETYASPPGAGCPPESKLGTVTIETPVLAERIEGAVYLAMPYANLAKFGTPAHPGGSLLALYVVAKAPARGIIVKSAGKIEADPVTGQLTSTFTELPQQPFSKVTLKLTQGPTSPLVSPPACGRYTVQAQLTPWSALNEPHQLSNSLEIEKGINGGPCPTGGVPPFTPGVIAGTVNNAAGSYSPFYLRITRSDGEQEITKFTTVLPPGLSGNLSGIPFCSNAQIEAARIRTGQEELERSSCPPASEIGHSLVGAGVGSVLAWTPGKVYLAGPYNGSALSIVSVTSATVGPFDLGTVVIRFALRINPTTAQVEIDSSGSDPIPHIIDGIVVHVRDIHVYVDRPNFTFNPTSCTPMPINETVTGTGADLANPADQTPVNVKTPFQAANCANLAFKPSLKASTASKTSRKNGASLTVKLTYPKAPQGTQANIHTVKVDLPKQLPARLTTLQKACPDTVFDANPATCPTASRVGQATAITPILPVPLSGPAYFVSHGGAKFPELIMVLQGYGITIDLNGETFVSKQGILSGTFRTVPDQPVNSFELNLPEGPNSALATTNNLCKLTRTITKRKKITHLTHGHKQTTTKTIHTTLPGTLTMPTAFTAQNGLELHQATNITVTGCPKKPSSKASKNKHTK